MVESQLFKPPAHCLRNRRASLDKVPVSCHNAEGSPPPTKWRGSVQTQACNHRFARVLALSLRPASAERAADSGAYRMHGAHPTPLGSCGWALGNQGWCLRPAVTVCPTWSLAATSSQPTRGGWRPSTAPHSRSQSHPRPPMIEDAQQPSEGRRSAGPRCPHGTRIRARDGH